ncbi:alpha/beta fold hydrolase [Dokdonia sp. Hel_I_53]|uniref:alpha/beta fold hydrolase n=1 Tax=Dokdonia sp. Hel_I_53 TaxID=1566287 RepID=UPI0011993B3E|nr:alpha/beta hydrolase [Dokdonia sp. Hel_I_53]TVZ52315.1 pimeloyl-ACP methyl ester carboxylesterase [Dokdonia sp. Hel_I_53]
MNIIHKGASIYYTDEGKGLPVVLLHGFLENKTMWDNFVGPLTHNYRVICIDLLGHGQSECTGYIHTMENMAAAVYAVVSILKISKIQIIGHSMGGYVGIAFAKAFPKITAGLCLLNSTPRPDDLARKKIRTRANEMAKTQYEQLIRMSFVNLFDPEYRKLNNEDISLALEQALKTPIQGYIAANAGMSLRQDHSDFWRKSTIKKGIIVGTTDSIIPSDIEEELFLSYCDFFKNISGGHMLHISNPEQVLIALKGFLNYLC